MLTVTMLKEEHLEYAALLVSKRYERLCHEEPHLPHHYAQVDNLLPLLQGCLNASKIGIAAIRAGRLVGFLTGWRLRSFRGRKSIYCPEWANAADVEDSRRIYGEMYSKLAAIWVADEYLAHYISLFSNDANALAAWHWMNFGMISVDAIRGLDSVPGCDMGVSIRRAEFQDLEQVMGLHEALRQYMKNSPVFLYTDRRDRNYYEEWLRSPDKVVWLAYWDNEPVAFMRLGPADEDACTIICDERTTSIYAAFAKEEVRGKGIATALLNHALESARVSGYERCAVPFEPMNLLGARFWLKHFKPVCFSVFRQIDDRLTQA